MLTGSTYNLHFNESALKLQETAILDVTIFLV